MIKYHKNRNDIIQRVEIDLAEASGESKQDIRGRIERINTEDRKIFKFSTGNRLVYETEVLIPNKINKDRLNLLVLLGNPAVHSVAEGIFFSYEKTRTGKRREHRFWRALRDCEILKFDKNVKEPTPENNEYKREHLLNGEYESDFNVFLLPYFSFPTPASGEYSGVPGIRKIVGECIFAKMKEFEFRRFKKIVLGNYIKNVICFQKTDAGKEIIEKAQSELVCNILNNPDYPVYKLGNALKYVTLYTAPPTRLLHTDKGKKILKAIIADIKDKNNIG